MTKNIFAVQYIIEETEPVRGWDSADHFISNVEELVTDASRDALRTHGQDIGTFSRFTPHKISL